MQGISAICPGSRDFFKSVSVLFSGALHTIFLEDEGSIPVRLLDLIISITARLAKVFNNQGKFPSFNSKSVEVYRFRIDSWLISPSLFILIIFETK